MTRVRPPLAAAAVLAVGAALAVGALTLLAGGLGLHPWAIALVDGGFVLCLAAGGVALQESVAARLLGRRDRMRQLTEMLAVSASEEESRALLLGHAQRVLPEGGAVMLTCSEVEPRLHPAFGDRVAETPLRGLLVGHGRPEACMAIRLGHAYRRDAARETLADCELCGRLAGESVCAPLAAGGRTLGSLLVASVNPIAPAAREELHDAIAIVAPRLALQRVLASAGRHAALDPLTGLPNRRAAEATLARLAAQAGRTVTSLAAVLVDLDRFAEVNERFGHELGDGAIAGVARTLADGVRASDFVARYGGQAFLVLAPDTGRAGAAELAEKLRREVAGASLPGVGSVTASFGVAGLPEDAAAAAGLVRRAERAVGIAKALGRNRVATPQPSAASDEV